MEGKSLTRKPCPLNYVGDSESSSYAPKLRVQGGPFPQDFCTTSTMRMPYAQLGSALLSERSVRLGVRMSVHRGYMGILHQRPGAM